jgi:hypothetical protein
MPNESLHILRIHRMNLYIFGEYCTWNEANIGMEFFCLYLLNTQNESVHILRIRGQNLFVY